MTGPRKHPDAMKDIFNAGRAASTAARLRMAFRDDPDGFEVMAREAAEQMAVDSLAVHFLLGVAMPPPELSYNEGTRFLQALSTRHGQIAARAALGSLEEFLADPLRFKRSSRVSRYSAHGASPQTR